MSFRRSLVSRAFACGAALGVLAIAACGPGSSSGVGIFSGGEWRYVCDAPRALGETCGTSDGCAAGLYCTEANSGLVGTCKARLSKGGACQYSEDCALGLVCQDVPVPGTCYLLNCDKNNTCTQGAASGSTCTLPTIDCPVGQLCAVAPLGPGKCVDEPKAGDSCDPFRALRMCGQSLTCQRLTAKCVTLPKAGELCGFAIEQCATGLVCRGDADPNKDGRCGSPIPLGTKCMTAGECAKGSYCDLGKLICQKNQGVGSSCKNGNECGDVPFDVHNGVDCVQGRCIDTTKAGANCWPGENNHCLSPLTCVPKK